MFTLPGLHGNSIRCAFLSLVPALLDFLHGRHDIILNFTTMYGEGGLVAKSLQQVKHSPPFFIHANADHDGHDLDRSFQGSFFCLATGRSKLVIRHQAHRELSHPMHCARI